VSLDRTALDPAALGPDAQKALGSPITKMMAARGLAPIADPRDLLAVLYQLAHDGDEKLRSSAHGSAGQLPPPVVAAGLGDPRQDARVLDYFAEIAATEENLAIVVRNPATAPATIARLAESGSEGLCDRIADNQERLLANPAIIAALYVNRRARMSTVDHAVELAVRNGVKVSGIAAWDELVQAYSGAGTKHQTSGGEIVELDDAQLDAAFRMAAEVNAERDKVGDGGEGTAEAADVAAAVPEKKVEIWQLSVPMKIRLATLGNAFDRAVLIRDPKKMVSIAVIKSPGVTEMEAAKYATNTGLSEEVINYIGNKREWIKLYNIKLALVMNPKCPLATAMRLLPHLREKDLSAVARSKGIPTALATQARKLTQARAKKE
jgi:hypothetical protein